MRYFVTTTPDKYPLPIDCVYATVDDVFNYFSDKDELEFDTETKGKENNDGLDALKGWVICAQFGNKDEQFIVDTDTVPLILFKELLETKLILMQNAKFDLQFLYVLGIFPPKVYDTFLAESVLYMGNPRIRKSLDVLAERYCGAVLDKSVRGKIQKDGLTPEVINYAGDDVRYLTSIKEGQALQIRSKNLARAVDLDNQFVKVLAYVEFCGFKLDGNKWSKKMEEDVLNLEEAWKTLNQYVFDNNINKYISSQLDLFTTDPLCTIKWSSPLQVVPLFKDLGINTQVFDKKYGKYKDSVDAKVLALQAKDFEIIPLFNNFQKQSKLVSTYGENVLRQIHPATGRIHTKFRQIQATGRMSCGETNKKRGIEHINLQNVPADHRHRSCFVPEEGNTFVVADYSGQESVVFANFSADPDLIDFYQKGMGDMHSFIAQKIYPELAILSLKEIKANHKDKRQNAKAAGFAIQFGGVGKTIADNLGLPLEEGEAIYTAYFKAFPGIKQYFAKCRNTVLSCGFVELNQISYRKSFMDFYDEYLEVKAVVSQQGFWEEYRQHKAEETSQFFAHYKPLVRKYFKWRGTMERDSYNYPIQGSAAEITKFGALKFFKYIVAHKLINIVKICNIVHDEIVIECPTEMGDEMASVLQQCMEDAGKPFCKIIPLKAEPWIGKYWNH